MATSNAVPPIPTLEESYAYCARLARSHYENFTITSWLTPQKLRPALQTIYAFCRHTDDLGDEASGDRTALLNHWRNELSLVYTGSPTHPVMVALQDVVHRFEIPDAPFNKLIRANEMDQESGVFQTYDDLLIYCDHSANPVGRMVLRVLGDRTEESSRLSDATCTALQLANFWQDVKRDRDKGRLYIPLDDIHRFNYSTEELAAGIANQAFRDLMRFEVERAQALFIQGLELVDRLHGMPKLDVALFSRGGMTVLDSIRAQNYDVLSKRPTVTKSRKLILLATTGARLAMRTSL